MKDQVTDEYNAYKAGKQGHKRLKDKSLRKQAKKMRDFRKTGKRGLWVELTIQEGNV